ncbi:hypothetical protein L198_06778 [Cryptococcus wingfieldii CBS 7118]|uniref:Uncharacterized protein n=1 Tax=Cryptococcus wingfieldii CBS 7118 TaxID=1295528 RepID=A0A1E3IHG8_9TREE|nr:hypothetical protein L198_06778 [Cryptococcus wingfieldii CBS 7118]ODN88039.1 hypothetical protein L198_06778 [Cryptococcus wingfieldii CBS 7118]
MSSLTDFYPYAFSDFFGSGTPCVYKTGPAWPIAREQKIVRAARPIYNHPIAPTWLETAWAIVAQLDLLQLNWNTVNPLAYANAGEAALICDFVITIGVQPRSLAYPAAVAAAQAVVEILEAAGFPEIQVAFIESVYRRHMSHPKRMSFNPILDSEGLPALRKPFTPTLSPSIAPLKSPYYEGSGGLYFRLNAEEGDNRVALLTCAHVAHPPPVSENKVYTRRNDSEAREEIILLGTGSYDAAVATIMKFINDRTIAITSWETARGSLPAQRDGEPKGVTSKRKALTDLIDAASNKIEKANQLHTDVTKHLTTTVSRVIGFVVHCAKIEVGEDQFMYDWSLIQMDEDKTEWDDFKGNKLFVGGNKTAVDWVNYMFPQEFKDRRGFHAPEDMLLALKDVVPEAEFRNPQNFDIHNVRTLLAVKNGRSTGTTFGRVNGLESITRHYPEHGIAQRTLEFIVCGYDTVRGKNDKFSDDGKSGSIVAGRDGRIIAQITGGGGPTDEADKTYVTPFYALQGAIKKKYPNCYLVPATVV